MPAVVADGGSLDGHVTSVRSAVGKIEQHLADRAGLDRVVGRGGLLQRVVVQRQAGLLAHPQRAGARRPR